MSSLILAVFGFTPTGRQLNSYNIDQSKPSSSVGLGEAEADRREKRFFNVSEVAFQFCLLRRKAKWLGLMRSGDPTALAAVSGNHRFAALETVASADG